MKFAHLADCHIGSWREPKLRDAATTAFCQAIDLSISEKVDFIIIAGDLFNTSFPRIENLKTVVTKLRELSDKDIPVYIVPGSHDYSPSGKTILDVLEEAGLFVNVFKPKRVDGKLRLDFTVDTKTGVKLTGMLGMRGALEKEYYKELDTDSLEREGGYKIFVFHSGLNELRGKVGDSLLTQSVSLLPKGFDYYAGGHVHIVDSTDVEGYGTIAYPGPLFPNSFSELEKLGTGGFYIVTDGVSRWHSIPLFKTESISIECSQKNPERVSEELLEHAQNKTFDNCIVLLRLSGILDGKQSDIRYRDIFSEFYKSGAYIVMRNSAGLSSKDYDEVRVDSKSAVDIERDLIKEHAGQFGLKDISKDREIDFITELLACLTSQRDESERVADFEKRLKSDASRLLRVDFE